MREEPYSAPNGVYEVGFLEEENRWTEFKWINDRWLGVNQIRKWNQATMARGKTMSQGTEARNQCM